MTARSPRHPWAVSAAWGWRWEVAFALVAGALFELGTATVGGPGGGLLLAGVVALVPWRIPWCRRTLAGFLRHRAVDRWFSKALRLCPVFSGWRPILRVRDDRAMR